MAVLFGSNYYEHRSYKYIKSIKLSQVVEALIVSKSFGPIGKSLADFIREIDSPDDKTQIQADFDSYCQAQDQIDSIFEDSNELCRRSITALSKCGDLSCDKSIITYCERVWSIKAVEVPNPATNPVHRVRSHSYLHLQESGSLERDDESYHSNMFNFDDGKGPTEGHSHDSRSGQSFDKIYKQKNKEMMGLQAQEGQIIKNTNTNRMTHAPKVFPSHDDMNLRTNYKDYGYIKDNH